MKRIFTKFIVSSLFCSLSTRKVVSLERAYSRPSVHEDPHYAHPDLNNLYNNAKDMTILSQYIYVHAALVKDSQEKPSKRFWPGKRITPEMIQKRLEIVEGTATVGDVVNASVDEVFTMDDEGSIVKDSVEVIQTDLGEGDNIGRTNDSVIEAIHANKEDMSRSCVYAITKHDEQKRVVMIFRGTSSTGDWFKDALILQTSLDNPASKLNISDYPQKIGIHSGFAKALLKDKDGPTGYVEKIIGELKAVMEKNPDYDLYIAGHSLGGALATLFGFYLASSGDDTFVKNSPIQVFSVSSPRVGNKAFRDTFKNLEERGLLRHARIYNARDKVAMLPYAGGAYRHVGLEIKLRIEGLEPRLDYPRYEGWTQSSKSVSTWQQIVSTADAVKFHGCPLVRRRLKLASEDLVETTLEEEYQKMWGLRE